MYSTPGVYIKQSAAPTSVNVSTAIPAFIGHTEKIPVINGEGEYYKPIRIDSLANFELIFGKEKVYDSYQVRTTQEGNFDSVRPSENRYFLYESVRLFYENGGEICYIVSVGNYESPVNFGNSIFFPGLYEGIQAIEKTDEITLIVLPDAPLINVPFTDRASKFGELQQLALRQCGRLKDRFCILDTLMGDNATLEFPINSEDGGFRTHIGTSYLAYGAAYYPWIKMDLKRNCSYFQLRDENGAPIGTNVLFEDDTSIQYLERLKIILVNNFYAYLNFTLTIPPNPMLSNPAEGYKMLKDEYDALRGNIIDAQGIFVQQYFTNWFHFIVDVSLTFYALEPSEETPLALVKKINQFKLDNSLIDNVFYLVQLNKDLVLTDPTSGMFTPSPAINDLNMTDWIRGEEIANIQGTNFAFMAAPPEEKVQALAYIESLIDIDYLFKKFDELYRVWLRLYKKAEADLFVKHPIFRHIPKAINSLIVPPSGAIAGTYTRIDRTNGIWYAPANVNLKGVLGPALRLNNVDQSELNVHYTGKSINVLRGFRGKGTMIFGARTLAGNDLEWRYISVRRLFINIEETLKKAIEPYLFETNDRNTWVKIKSLAYNYLTLQWRSGALKGETSEQAFYIKVGLGETMSSQDVLEGRMIVEIGLAAVRPAEFIVLTITQVRDEL